MIRRWLRTRKERAFLARMAGTQGVRVIGRAMESAAAGETVDVVLTGDGDALRDEWRAELLRALAVLVHRAGNEVVVSLDDLAHAEVHGLQVLLHRRDYDRSVVLTTVGEP